MSTAGTSDTSEIDEPEVSTIVRTLAIGGFVLEGAQRNPGYMLLHANRYDEFGVLHRYSFAFAERRLFQADIDAATIAARHHQAELVVIGEVDDGALAVEWSRFVNLFGGPVMSLSPLDPQFSDHLVELGYNRLPEGLQGRADDLFELHIQAALEFILAGRVVRYGQERRFEARPDGIALPSLAFSALYDAKAASGGYDVTLESIRQFKSYVDDFHRRYNAFLPRLNAFLVISGAFSGSEDALRQRSAELLSECAVPLSFVTAECLSDMIVTLSKHPQTRRSVNWARVFADPIPRSDRVKSEVTAITRNGIVRRP